ncbi:thioredoxin domain-containing protein [Paracoccus alkenifer]|uniref:Protein-disulfide isomerase n=1 Tax=Paracoccus alkenifer TaxID=65735 RepID=A0A1H6MYG6_9RHOB|nr:thioredoxin domain-containing protein [Paracoccus alkenifer]SEI07286.1 Protein-disulfide isomerase [Paracoccus alkenifer]
MDNTRRMMLGAGGALILAGFVGGGMALRRLAAELADTDVLDDPDIPLLGNPTGDVTIVEFFDYQCPFCKRGHQDLLALAAEDGNIRLMMRDWPVFGAPSVLAAQLVLGAASLGEYAPAHNALMATEGRLAAPQIRRALAGAGVDHIEAEDAFRRDRARWDALLSRNAAHAARMGLQGTPVFAIGRAAPPGATVAQAEIHRGAMGIPAMRRAVANARRQG